MQFELVEASADSPCVHADPGNQRGRLWPVYQTAELLMARMEIADKGWCFAASDIAYFLYVEEGTVSVAFRDRKVVLEVRRAIEIPENVEFNLANVSAETSYVVMVAGKELLPGSFFNSFTSAYLNT